ncbi:cell division protein FtsL [Niallia sp. 01092]|uniref:cell division protein FtsL n=1 Tax=unclassified Niallia TaxID=2837522 RepID=UPI003FD5C827
MSNLARKLQEESYQSEQQTVKKVIKQTKSLLSPGEKILGVTFAALLCFGAVKIVGNQAEIYQVNKNIQIAQNSINKLEKSNKELDIQVKDLSSFERIRKAAEKLGLDFSKDNVKVVQ